MEDQNNNNIDVLSYINFELIKSSPIPMSSRHVVSLKKDLLKKPLLKKNIKGINISNGRNLTGQITVRHKGGGHKKKYRKIDFKRTKSITGLVTSLEYDPFRSANIASVFNFYDKKFFYIIAPHGLKIGDVVKSGLGAKTMLGHSLPLREIPIGTFIHNISIFPNKSAQVTRSAGTSSIIKEKTYDNSIIELSSGEEKIISSDCYATIGFVSNELTFLTQLGKAGKARWVNKRPSVRGVAMNPVDHPNGGGEGKKSGTGKTPWGKPVKRRKK